MPKEQFCVICGKITSNLLDGRCESCYSEEHPIASVSNPPSVVICPRCQRYLRKGKWMGKPRVSREEVLWRAVIPAVEDKVELIDGAIMDIEPQIQPNSTNSIPKEIACRIHVEGRLHPQLNELQFDSDVNVEITQRLCDDCMKQRGGYFEAIIQIRGDRLTKPEEEKILQYIDHIGREFSHSAITRFENIKSGFDVYFSSKSRAKTIALRLAKTYGMSQKVSFKIVGRRDGKPLQRLKILLTLPPIIIGDIVKTKKGVFRVLHVTKSSFQALNLTTGNKTSIQYRDEYTRLDLSNKTNHYMVVATGQKSLQLMDLTNYRTIEIDHTDLTHDIQQGTNIKAAFIDGKLIILSTIKSTKGF